MRIGMFRKGFISVPNNTSDGISNSDSGHSLDFSGNRLQKFLLQRSQFQPLQQQQPQCPAIYKLHSRPTLTQLCSQELSFGPILSSLLSNHHQQHIGVSRPPSGIIQDIPINSCEPNPKRRKANYNDNDHNDHNVNNLNDLVSQVLQNTSNFDAQSQPVMVKPENEKEKEKEKEKHTLQCCGTNRKKKVQCRNAALMEYIGPRPLYCAEHISLDPNAMYHKCNFLLDTQPKKRCKEIVFKDFKYCYKHFTDWLEQDFVGSEAAMKASFLLENVSSILTRLELEASTARMDDVELYQRKCKLVPKYQRMIKSIRSHLSALEKPPPQQEEQKSLISTITNFEVINATLDISNLHNNNQHIIGENNCFPTYDYTEENNITPQLFDFEKDETSSQLLDLTDDDDLTSQLFEFVDHL